MAVGDDRRYLDLPGSKVRLEGMSFVRKQLGHSPPEWVAAGETFFITICLEDRNSEYLIQPEVAEAVRVAADVYQIREYWWLQLLVLMPNHLHALIAFDQRARSISETIRNWKRYLNRHAGIEWQRGYFDHRIRSNDSGLQKAEYIRNNPVRAGLVDHAVDWNFTWSADTLGSGGRP